MRFALTGARIHDGARFLPDAAVVVAGGRVETVLQADALPAGLPVEALGGGILAPGFIDLQVNGGGGVLLNDSPDAEGVRRISQAHRAFGTTALLPTVITDAPEVMHAAARAVHEARAQGVPGVIGLHIEGPFIDPRRKGAHPPRHIRPLGEEDIAWLADLDCGVVLLTLAPSHVDPVLVRRLADAGIIVSLGHSEATEQEARAALAAGARGFTHLFNAMSQLGHRSPGMVGAALADRDSFVGVIADGFHVDDTALRVALAAKPRERIVLVSDAMPPAAGGPDLFHLQGRPARRRNGRLELEDGTLAGSNLTMDEAVRFAVERLAVPLEEALRMASLNPACWIRQEGVRGRVAPGLRADLVHLGEDLRVRRTWIGGIAA